MIPQFPVRLKEALARVAHVIDLIDQSCWKLGAIEAVEVIGLERFQGRISRIAVESLVPSDGEGFAAEFAGRSVQLLTNKAKRFSPIVLRTAAAPPSVSVGKAIDAPEALAARIDEDLPRLVRTGAFLADPRSQP